MSVLAFFHYEYQMQVYDENFLISKLFICFYHYLIDLTEKKLKMESLYVENINDIDCFVPGVPVKVKINEFVRTPRSHVLSPNL